MDFPQIGERENREERKDRGRKTHGGEEKERKE